MSFDDRAAPRRRRRSPARRGEATWSGPGPDARDPQRIGDVLGKLVRDRGWRRNTAQAGIFARWGELVGPEIAAHCRPVSCDKGELIIEAESAAWATQLRLFKTQILQRLSSGVGPDMVTRVRINGPSQPSYVTGPRRVRFRQ
ncbi:MAG TPA: DciA family protein [Stackebrandtia sp.]|uniref:DUF721 domain-containing protein n=1 Tax=Stackebrandtia sp. TaxID=2023065 RepID=UPI002D4D4F3C|nr:DciA family protein [Stackebrandtia sp.]HZE40837.1 DciA family protein [Stackebrandtia sp.]